MNGLSTGKVLYMRGQTEGSHEEINVEEAIRIHGNMVYRLALVQMKIKVKQKMCFRKCSSD